MKLYLAARFNRMKEMAALTPEILKRGHIITAQWITGKEDATGMTRRQAAVMDAADVRDADALLFFAEPRGSSNIGGGRHWEFGYAYALGKACLVIGDSEQVFCDLPNVVRVPDLTTALGYLEGVTNC